MGVLMQTFYWNCPSAENQEFNWWNNIKSKIPTLSDIGFTALWLPPCNKAASNVSMGYDTYDYYDLGDLNQKGSAKTWFGSKDELTDLIDTAHNNRLSVYADLVIHQNSGGDAEEVNPIDGISRWTKFNPLSQKFPRTYLDFQPSIYETIDGLEPITFGAMPNLCHRNPDVYTQILEYAEWLLETVGFDGFRYDCVAGYGGWMVRAIQELRVNKNNASFIPFGVGECWASDYTINEWLNETNSWSDNPSCAFDFLLRQNLKNLCDDYGFSLKGLTSGSLLNDNASLAVTFVENHDIVRLDPIINDKMLAYAVILTHEGYPCVFWQDYYNWDLAQEDNNSGIAALVKVHEQYAGGPTDILYCDDNLYIMQRRGFGNQKGLILVLNNGGAWNGKAVQTLWSNREFIPVAWRGDANADIPENKFTDNNGSTDFWAPARGYAVYV
ncbi:MAG TPA: alpha-amylase family glycosyl hydrolase [Ferruginibacter sp.]|nr:alpha-amylase family glycosyl hydrolase [Ferruginibacter sp.]